MDTITARLLSELRDAGHSWYRIARLLAVRDQTVTKWKAGGGMSDESAVRACAALGKSAKQTAAILAVLSAERAGDAETRAAWADVLKRLGGAVAAVMLALGHWGGPTPPAALGAVAAAHASQSAIMVNRLELAARALRTLISALLAPLAWRPA